MSKRAKIPKKKKKILLILKSCINSFANIIEPNIYSIENSVDPDNLASYVCIIINKTMQMDCLKMRLLLINLSSVLKDYMNSYVGTILSHNPMMKRSINPLSRWFKSYEHFH